MTWWISSVTYGDRKVVGSTPDRFTIRWLQLRWVTVFELVNHNQHQGQLSLSSLCTRWIDYRWVAPKHIHLCRVVVNAVWFHMAGDAPSPCDRFFIKSYAPPLPLPNVGVVGSAGVFVKRVCTRWAQQQDVLPGQVQYAQGHPGRLAWRQSDMDENHRHWNASLHWGLSVSLLKSIYWIFCLHRYLILGFVYL